MDTNRKFRLLQAIVSLTAQAVKLIIEILKMAHSYSYVAEVAY